MRTLALTNVPLADSWSMHGGWGSAWMAPMMLGMVVFWAAIVLGIVWLVREGAQRREPAPRATALTILDRRFAEGALSADDYHQRRSILGGTTPDSSRGGRSPASEGTRRS